MRKKLESLDSLRKNIEIGIFNVELITHVRNMRDDK